MNVNHERLVNNKIGKYFVQFLSTRFFFLVCLFVFYLFLFLYFILLEISLVRSAH